MYIFIHTYMQTHTHHEHDLSYLLKTDHVGRYYARVLQIPAIITQGKSEAEIGQKIVKATKDYFKTFKDEHKAFMKSTPKPKLTFSGKGIIVRTQTFKVKC